MKSKLIISSILVALSFNAIAQESKPKQYFPDAQVCQEGEALTYTVQCDPGTRPPVDRIWNPAGAGFEVCRVSRTSCQPIDGFNPNHRPGHDVLDSNGGAIAVVDFEVGRVMGLEPY